MKKQPKSVRYRVALFKGDKFHAVIETSDTFYKREDDYRFVKWLTKWVRTKIK